MAGRKPTTTTNKTASVTRRETAQKRTPKKAETVPQEKKEEFTEATPVPAEKPPMFTAAEVQAMIAQAVAQAQAQAQTAPQIVQISQDVEKVHFLWQAEVADDNVVTFGDGGMYGRITGKSGTFYVPKPDVSRILTSMNRHFLDKRWLIVVSGLNEEERENLGVNYKEGEILDRKAFKQMLDLGDNIIPIYRDLCDGHKEMVAKRYYEAFKAGKKYPRERIIALKDASGTCEGAAIAFKTIIEEMNAADAN